VPPLFFAVDVILAILLGSVMSRSGLIRQIDKRTEGQGQIASSCADGCLGGPIDGQLVDEVTVWRNGE